MHKKILPLRSENNKKTSQFKDFDEYQKFCKDHAIYPAIGKKFVYALVGLSEEVGEISGKIKKIYRDDHGKMSNSKKEEIAKEIGDAMFYMSQLCTDLNLKLSDVIKINKDKISYRKAENKVHGSGDNR